MSGWTTSLLTGLAEHLAANAVGTWHPDGSAYASTDTAIVIGAMPAEPERAIVLGAYPLSEDIAQADVTVGVQIRTRAGADVRDVLDLDDAIFDLLQGQTQCVLGDVDVVRVYRTSSASMGQRTDTGRWERTSNYRVLAMRRTDIRPY